MPLTFVLTLQTHLLFFSYSEYLGHLRTWQHVLEELQCVVFMFISLHTCEDPHGSMHGIDISADQHLHQQGEQLRPGLGPVPVGDGRHSVRNTGTDFADRLPQTAWQQLPDGSFSLQGDNSGLTRFSSEGPLRPN